MLAIGQLDDPACDGRPGPQRGACRCSPTALLLAARHLGHSHALLADGALAGLAGRVARHHRRGCCSHSGCSCPTVMVIATLYMERIARAVEARHYRLPPRRPLLPPLIRRRLWDGLGPWVAGPPAECRGSAAGAAHPRRDRSGPGHPGQRLGDRARPVRRGRDAANGARVRRRHSTGAQPHSPSWSPGMLLAARRRRSLG